MKKITTQEKMNAVVKTLTPSGYKMGDKFTLTVGNLTATYDNRQYYSGRGAKYNSSIRHGSISVTMTERELSKAYKPIAEKIKKDKKRAIELKKYLKMCMNPDFIAKEARNAVDVIEASTDGYHGCGVYRTGWRNGKMTCTLYRGFHGSCPYGIDEKAWIEAVILEMKKYSDHIVKMDGSGTEFFFRNMEDADLVTNATQVYCVPTLSGGLHLNIQPAFAEVIATNQITNG
jgi:hypothetical protein